MAAWDSADLLARVKAELQRPTTDEALTDADIYELLDNAQWKWLGIMATHVPESQMGTPEQLTTSDGGLTYMFPSVYDSTAPIGRVELRDGRSGPVLIPGNDWDDWADFVIERGIVRIPSNRTRSFANGLWARYIKPPTRLTSSNPPVLRPEWARVLLVYQAAADWASRGGLRDPSPYLAKLQSTAWGDPRNPGDVGIVGQLKMQYFGRGRSASPAGGTVWYRSGDLG